MDFLQRNLFAQLRNDHFGSKETMEPMTDFKRKKIAQMRKNLNDMPTGEALLANSFLNRRLTRIQNEERHAIDTSLVTVDLLRLIVSNVNAMLAGGISLPDIIQLGKFLRTRGDKVDFVKLETWLRKLRMQRMAQLEGSVLITFFNFEKVEIPFVHHIEKGAYELTLRSLYFNIQERQEIEFEQSATGLVHSSRGTMRKSLRQSMRYFGYAPVETTSNFLGKLFRSISEIEE